MVDAWLGDGPYHPLPLSAGMTRVHRQGPFRYRLEPSPAEPGGWRFVDLRRFPDHACADVAPEPVAPADLTPRHRQLSTDPDSPFVRVVTVQRRDSRGHDLLRGRVLTLLDDVSRPRASPGPPGAATPSRPQRPSAC